MDDLNAPSHLSDHKRFAEPSRYAAVVVANILDRWIEMHTVLDLGCGTGTWLRGFAASGRRGILGVEGERLDPQHLEIDPNLILHADLGEHLDLQRRFDLVICMEVAEHVAAEHAETVVGNCIRHGDVVLFSAALPGQQGRHHINEQLPEYWVEMFRSRGFVVFDIIRPRIWNDKNIPIWYRQNILLFVRDGLPIVAQLQIEAERAASAVPLNRAHPDLLRLFSRQLIEGQQTNAELTKANAGLRRELAETTGRLITIRERAEAERRAGKIATDAVALLTQEREIIVNSTVWRMTGPIRRVGGAVPAPVRHMLWRIPSGIAAIFRKSRSADGGARADNSASPRPLESADNWRIVVVSGEPDNPGHYYRVVRFAEAAKALGATVLSISLAEAAAHQQDLIDADLTVIWRAANAPEVAATIEAVRTGSGKLLVDVDDLMFVPELAYEDIIDGIRTQNLNAREVAGFFQRVREVAAQADACICTTHELAMYARQLEKVTFILPNGFDPDVLAASRLAVRRRRARQDEGLIRIGYATGTLTHQRDFRPVTEAIARILRETPSCRLVLFRDPVTERPRLDVHEFTALHELFGQIEWRDMVPLAELPDELARFDINIAPLETGNPFCEAKSELKYFEAALAGVCTLASPTGAMQRAIRDDVTGKLADQPEEWYAALRSLVDDAALRQRLAHAAYIDVLWRFGPERRQDLLLSMLQQLRGGPEAARAFELQWLRDNTQASHLPDIPTADLLFATDKFGLAAVTVVIPLYNYAVYVEEALESVRGQTLAVIDLVVVDDASTDDSLGVALRWVQQYADRFNRVVVMRNRANSGLARTRNVGFDAAETPYVLPLDADNRLRPDCCEKSLAILQGSRAAFAYPMIQCFGGSDHVIGLQSFMPLRFASNNYVDAMALVAKWAWAAIGGYVHIEFGWEDYDFWCRCIERGIWGLHIPEILADYRFHEASMLRTTTEMPANKQKVVSTLEGRHPWLSILPDQSVD